MITDSDDDRIKTVFSDFVNKFCINLTSDYTSFLKRRHSFNLVPRAFPFLSLGRREKALAPGGLLCILIGQ
jgi:hypothetical protein